jgi:hypothetical protein
MSFANYTLTNDIVPTDCTKIGYDDDLTQQPGDVLFAYNGVPYQSADGVTYINAPGSPSASGWTGQSPFSCSASGVSVTFSKYNGTFQTALLNTQNQLGNGSTVTLGAFVWKVTAIVNTTGLFPDVAEWSSDVTKWNPGNCYDEHDSNETNLVSGSPTTGQMTEHWHVHTCIAPPGVANAPDPPGNTIQNQWTGNVLDGNQHTFCQVFTPFYVINGNDIVSGVPGLCAEVGRKPIISAAELGPKVGQWGIGNVLNLSGASPTATYTATLNELKEYSCTPALC